MALPRPAFENEMTPTTRTRSAAVRCGAKFGRLKDKVEKASVLIQTESLHRLGEGLGLLFTPVFTAPACSVCLFSTPASNIPNFRIVITKRWHNWTPKKKLIGWYAFGGGLVCSLGTHWRVQRRARFIKPPSDFPNVFMQNSFLMQIMSKLDKAQQGSPLREFVSARRKLEHYNPHLLLHPR